MKTEGTSPIGNSARLPRVALLASRGMWVLGRPIDCKEGLLGSVELHCMCFSQSGIQGWGGLSSF